MNEKEAGQLLLIISDFVPNYQPSKSTARSWQRVLGQMSFADAEKYLLDYFRQNRFQPYPVDIFARYREDFDPDKIVPLEPPADMRGASTDG